jgi:myo-inositol 2-dehydrogenase / D-chiro-inositol 1-dehydrogenase
MKNNSDSSGVQAPSRREFLKNTGAIIAGGAIAGSLPVEIAAQGNGNDVLRIGLIGCGGRGTGAATEALQADKNSRLVAMGDAFADRLEGSLEMIKKNTALAERIDVPPERRFVGFDAYRKVIASGVDVVLLAAPPHFRPQHLKASVEAGKHVFAEKPVAVDGPGVRSVLASCEEAKKKNLSVVSGLCFRYHEGFVETIKRIHDGALGEIRGVQANDYRGAIWVKPRQPEWSDMEWQMRNWYYFTWLSGDFNVEQHVHYLDVCTWIMGQYPVRALGVGGRTVRTGPEYGNIYDHHHVTYEYANGAKLYATCRQFAGCHNDISAHVLGSKGLAVLSDRKLAFMTDSPWEYKGPKTNMYQNEQDVFFASIRSGKPINNGDYMAKSTLLAIMGRMATYTGQLVTWEQAMNSKEDLTPPHYEWTKLATPAIAVPGVTELA